ncbi:uncharacterized protein LTR77_002234 [Saxophila tyrrhenica]|uniref:GH64 domain-containing protein n=1 Tax=Saxophila tyrrhenica TaxID=1690608 RepID=A0AAV9PIW1_9PEZI|nr:hypothetical protein LTR77_002234 [Saxophila tyrrhenica]
MAGLTRVRDISNRASLQDRSLSRRQRGGFLGNLADLSDLWSSPGHDDHGSGPADSVGPPFDPAPGPPGGPQSGNTLLPTFSTQDSTTAEGSTTPTTSSSQPLVISTSVSSTPSVTSSSTSASSFPASTSSTSPSSLIPQSSAPSTSPPPPPSSTGIAPSSSQPTTSSEPGSSAPRSDAPSSPPTPSSTSISSQLSASATPTASSQVVVPTSGIPSSSTVAAPSARPSPSGSVSTSTGNTLQISLVNNLGSSDVHAYVTGLDSTGQVVMLTTSGTYFYPTASGSGAPEEINADVALPMSGPGETTTIRLPDYLSSARVWFADGSLTFYVVETRFGPGLVEPTAMNLNDPSADVNWGFVELTFQADYGLFANLSFVDFVGLPLGIQLQAASNGVFTAPGVPTDAVSQVCDLLQAQAAQDGQPWDDLCVSDANGNLLRVVSPPTIISQDPTAFAGYFDSYVDEIYERYTSSPLTIDTQTSAGLVPCTSDGESLTCAGDPTPFPKPTSEDIFGCNSGPFAISESDNDVHAAIVPRLCAAFNRATLHLQGGDVQPSLPPSSYYTTSPTNWYSAFVHQVEIDGRGYAFSYDDVTPSGAEDVSGSVYAADPEVLTVFVGGTSS